MEKSSKAKKVKGSGPKGMPTLESKTKLSDVLQVEFYESYNPEVLQWSVVKQLQGSIMAAEGVEDPILVFKAEGKHFVIDGKHRLAALREIAAEAKAKQQTLVAAKAELDVLEQGFRATLQNEVDDAFEAYRKDQEGKGKPVGTKKEQEKYRERLFARFLKSSASITTEDRRKYQALLTVLDGKKKVKGEEPEGEEVPKGKERSVLDWTVPFKIQSFSTIDELDKYYHKNLLDIDKGRAHDLNKINHLIDRFEIYKNRADKDNWSYEKIAAYYKSDLSTVNRVMQLRHVENSIKRFIAENEAADLEKSIQHKYRLKLGHIYRHISKAGANKELIEADAGKIANYPTAGNVKEKNTAAVLEFIRHEARYGKPHPECPYIGKSRSAQKKGLDESQESERLDVEDLISWGKGIDKFKKLPWSLVQQLLNEYLKSK